MITHIIYHIPGKKVGCTKNLKARYIQSVVEQLEILEELYDKTDQEAGDIEWQWADRFGYKRGMHYTATWSRFPNIADIGRVGGHNRAKNLSPERRIQIARGARLALTAEQRIAQASRAGFASAKATSSEEKTANGKRNGSRTAALKVGAAFQRGQCPHCGTVTTFMVLGRLHFDRCRNKPKQP